MFSTPHLSAQCAPPESAPSSRHSAPKTALGEDMFATAWAGMAMRYDSARARAIPNAQSESKVNEAATRKTKTKAPLPEDSKTGTSDPTSATEASTLITLPANIAGPPAATPSEARMRYAGPQETGPRVLAPNQPTATERPEAVPMTCGEVISDADAATGSKAAGPDRPAAGPFAGRSQVDAAGSRPSDGSISTNLPGAAGTRMAVAPELPFGTMAQASGAGDAPPLPRTIQNEQGTQLADGPLHRIDAGVLNADAEAQGAESPNGIGKPLSQRPDSAPGGATIYPPLDPSVEVMETPDTANDQIHIAQADSGTSSSRSTSWLGGNATFQLSAQTATASAVSQQIAQTVTQRADGQIDIALSPEELGRVRLTLRTQDAGLTLTIHAERPETLDLMRRHIELLERDFRGLGYSEISFSFGQGAEGDVEDRGLSAASETHPPPGIEHDPVIDAPAPHSHSGISDSGLDLRI